MANFTGTDYTSEPISILANGISANVTAASQELVASALSITSRGTALSRGVPSPAVSVAHRSLAGHVQELFGGRLFERIIVSPRLMPLGYVLSATSAPLEVWNAFRNADQTLLAIVISGSGGVSLPDPYGEPLLFGALDSYIYRVTMPVAGPPTISQGIVFTFRGDLAGLSGADVLITGSRVTVFSVAPDWSGGIKESISFLTEVLVAYSDNEQRRALRQIARRGLKFLALTLNSRDAAGMEALLWGWQNQPYGVPWWQDATPLTGDIPAGTLAIACDAIDRQFAVGGLVILWRNEYTYEAHTVGSVSDVGLTVTSPIGASWTAGPATLVIPVFLARLSNQVKVDRLWSGADAIALEFSGEAQQAAPAPIVTLPTYKGFPVVEEMPNWASTLGREYKRSVALLDPKIGPITAIDKGGTAIIGQEFPWYLANHAAVTRLRAFLLGQFGQLRPFWVPTWDQDLVLQSDVGASDAGISISSCFYTQFLFPSKARQYVAFIPTDRSGNVYAKITNATDNGDGTETLTLETPTGKAFPKASTQISFLTLARLASDDSEIEWMTNDLAQCSITFQEVPREVP